MKSESTSHLHLDLHSVDNIRDRSCGHCEGCWLDFNLNCSMYLCVPELSNTTHTTGTADLSSFKLMSSAELVTVLLYNLTVFSGLKG